MESELWSFLCETLQCRKPNWRKTTSNACERGSVPAVEHKDEDDNDDSETIVSKTSAVHCATPSGSRSK